MDYNVKVLSVEDLKDYKEIRLELLNNEPTNFGSSFDDESKFDDEKWKSRINNDSVYSFGSYLDGEIVGICVLKLSPREKMKHVGTIHSMYVKHKYRNQGLAYDLIIEAEKLAKKKGVKRLNLSVVASNIAAYNLYYKIGFVEYGIEPDAIKHEGELYSLRLMSKVI